MVKNTQGGNKSKGFARKNLVKKDYGLRVAQEEGEIYAQAVKVLGGSIVSAIDTDGKPLRGHIRGKFRGKGKRDNFIGPDTWLLVGLHTWEGEKTKSDEIRNCDILEVYNDSDKNRLKTTVTSVNWSKFIANDSKTSESENKNNIDNDFDEIKFVDDATQEYEELISSQAVKGNSNMITMDDSDVINVDDI
jgi:hypothetical protein